MSWEGKLVISFVTDFSVNKVQHIPGQAGTAMQLNMVVEINGWTERTKRPGLCESSKRSKWGRLSSAPRGRERRCQLKWPKLPNFQHFNTV